MIEMDQFTVNLNGKYSQTIKRKSEESALTMKGEGPTLISYIKNMEDRDNKETFCGWPVNMLLPRYHLKLINIFNNKELFLDRKKTNQKVLSFSHL